MEVFVETGVGGHIDDAVQAWTFDPRFWGRCGQGTDEASAIAALKSQLPTVQNLVVLERIHGDELAFDRDLQMAQQVERDRTKSILRDVRSRTIEVLRSCTEAQLDWVDPERQLPSWATWNSLRSMGWHILDTESRYYLSKLGHGAPRESEDLLEVLQRAPERVHRAIDQLRPDLIVEQDSEVWTTTKVLRRLAWHERAELHVIEQLEARATTGVEPS